VSTAKTLILGGVRSGKSRLAERLAADTGRPVTCIATATAGDPEMAARIAAHRARRPRGWRVIEEPIRLAQALDEARGDCVIVDCLTLWLTNLLGSEDPGLLRRERTALLEILPRLPGPVCLVSNETGLGLVAANPLGRRFCDEAGRLHQDLAALCDRVVLTVAGLPLVMKGEPL